MSYRDDAAALLARCNALERELATARREIAMLRREAGYTVADEPPGPEVEVREDDVKLARRVLAGLLDEPGGAARAVAAPRELEPSPVPERDAGTAELVVLRRALVALLARRLGEVSAALVARVDACPTAAQLIEWIAAIGSARGRRQIIKILE